MAYPEQYDATINLGIGNSPSRELPLLEFRELSLLYQGLMKLTQEIDKLSAAQCIYDANCTYGQVMNILDTAGVQHARLASAAAATPFPALGFCSRLSGVASGDYGDVQYQGKISGLVGLTCGAIYYLSDVTPGAYQTAKPVGVGKLVQPVGFAMSPTVLYFCPTLLYTTL